MSGRCEFPSELMYKLFEKVVSSLDELVKTI